MSREDGTVEEDETWLLSLTLSNQTVAKRVCEFKEASFKFKNII